MVDKTSCVQLGLTCANVCQALCRGIDGGPGADRPNQSSLRTIEQFTTWVWFDVLFFPDDSLIDLAIAGL